jgi:FlaA1/EpsC-like NDP-sugar epimerase
MLDTLFDRYEIEYVFHAAAHKHVPLMEHVPSEAFNNNIFGTYTLVKAADAHHVKRFVMISTDKAVNPTSVMGATKRVCEMIVQAYDKRSDTDFVSVRFGNVLGSHGSVIPIFREQIANGGPITVTDKRMVRYFMMIDEAVSLVITAGVKAKGGEIFVLDMGSPVRIYDLAQNMIRFSGLKDSDIKIEITGLREGEKLYEEPLLSKETADKTEDELIYIGHPKEFDEGLLFKTLDETYPKRAELTANQAVSLLKLLVKEFQHDEYEYKNII